MKLEKIRFLTIENLYNLDVYYIIEIFLVLYRIYIIFKDQNKLVFYSNIILIKINSINYILLIR